MAASADRPVVFITDYAWPDTEVERQVIEGAGFRLVAGPATPAPAAKSRHSSNSTSRRASSRTGRRCQRKQWA